MYILFNIVLDRWQIIDKLYIPKVGKHYNNDDKIFF